MRSVNRTRVYGGRAVAAIVLVAALALAQVGCGTATVLTDIQIALDAIAALQSALPLAGVPPALASEIGEYATAAANGVGQCAAVLSAGGETVTLIAKCGQDLATAVKPALPLGTPQTIIGLVDLVYSELQVVYAAIEAGQAGGTTVQPAPKIAASNAAIPTTWHPSKRDAAKFRALAVKAAMMAGGHK